MKPGWVLLALCVIQYAIGTLNPNWSLVLGMLIAALLAAWMSAVAVDVFDLPLAEHWRYRSGLWKLRRQARRSKPSDGELDGHWESI